MKKTLVAALIVAFTCPASFAREPFSAAFAQAEPIDADESWRRGVGGSGGEPATQGYIHWTKRVGPAYPDDFWRSFGRWGKELPETLWDDTKAVFTNRWALVGLGAAAASGAIVHCSDADWKTLKHYREHGSCLNSFWDNFGDVAGNPGTHFAVAGTMFLTSLARNDTANYEKSKTLINALAINGLVTLGLKGIVRSDVPNGNGCGWPSGHTSSSFCFATVMHREYGPWVGVPCYALAAFVGYERVDARNHDLSDVVSGALIGMAIGYAVSEHHQERLQLLGMDIVPWTDPSCGGVGIALAKQW